MSNQQMIKAADDVRKAVVELNKARRYARTMGLIVELSEMPFSEEVTEEYQGPDGAMYTSTATGTDMDVKVYEITMIAY